MDNWNRNLDEVPKGKNILFCSKGEVKFGQFAYYTENEFECLSEMITPDGEYERYKKEVVDAWTFLPNAIVKVS